MKKTFYLVISLMLLSVALPLHAQSGCGDSPEAPTAILALLGTSGAFFISARSRFNARKSRKR